MIRGHFPTYQVITIKSISDICPRFLQLILDLNNHKHIKKMKKNSILILVKLYLVYIAIYFYFFFLIF